MWDNEAYLIKIITGVDDIGDTTEQISESHVFCNELSIGQNEFYQAHSQGLKPEIKLEINRIDYNGEQRARYNNTTYKVIRTFVKGDIIEITLEGDVHNAST